MAACSILVVANRRLRQELDERETAESEKLKLQDHLQRAQKMDALGTLAGGRDFPLLSSSHHAIAEAMDLMPSAKSASIFPVKAFQSAPKR